MSDDKDQTSNNELDKDNQINNENQINNNITLFKFINIPICSNNCIDFSLIIISSSSIIFGFIACIIINNITGIGYITTGIFSSITLIVVKKMRLRATIQKSVNILKEENNELRENNDELKENVDDLEKNVDDLEENIINFKCIEKTLREDINNLKKIIGLVDNNSEDVLNELRIIIKKLSDENKKHEFLVKNQIISYLYANQDKIENYKSVLLELYKNIEWNEIVEKIKLERF